MKHSSSDVKQQRLPPSVPVSELKSYFECLYSTPVSRQPAIPEGPPNNFSLTQFQPVTARRVKDLLMKLNEKKLKAAWHDGICSKELKVVADKIAWQLAILFTESLETGEIPSDFKVGNNIPIFKSGKKDVTAPENYRGISLTPLVSKVLERIVFEGSFCVFVKQKACSASFNSDSELRTLAQTPPCNSRWLAPSSWQETVHNRCLHWPVKGIRQCSAWAPALDSAGLWH